MYDKQNENKFPLLSYQVNIAINQVERDRKNNFPKFPSPGKPGD